MYADMVDILIFLYENYMDGERVPPADVETLEEELAGAGFDGRQVRKALDWLDELAERSGAGETAETARHSLRCFHPREQARLDTRLRGLILFLEQSGILDPGSRELVIDRALAMDKETLGVEDLKWIVLLVLMNRPGKEAAFSVMEDLIYDPQPVKVH